MPLLSIEDAKARAKANAKLNQRLAQVAAEVSAAPVSPGGAQVPQIQANATQQMHAAGQEAARQGASTETVQLTVQQELDNVKQQLAAVTEASRRGWVPGSSDATHKGQEYSPGRAVLAQRLGKFSELAPLEHEAHVECIRSGGTNSMFEGTGGQVQYAMGTSPDSDGTILVPNEIAEGLTIRPLLPNLIPHRLGATDMPMTIPVKIPIRKNNVNTQAVPENRQGEESQLEWGYKTPTPHSAHALTRASEQLMAQLPLLDAEIKRSMREQLSQKMNMWALKGVGGQEPTGIMSTDGVNNVSFASVSVGIGGLATGTYQVTGVPYKSYALMLGMKNRLAENEVMTEGGSVGWAMSHRAMLAAKSIKSENTAAGEDKAEVVRIVTSQAGVDRVDSDLALSTGQLDSGAASEMIAGVWDNLNFVRFGNLAIKSTNEAAGTFTRRQVLIMSYLDCDIILRRPEAFIVVDDWDLTLLGQEVDVP